MGCYDERGMRQDTGGPMEARRQTWQLPGTSTRVTEDAQAATVLFNQPARSRYAPQTSLAI